MNSVALIAVGIDEFSKSSKILLDSIGAHEPSARLVLVDNQAEPKYPHYPHVQIVRTAERLSMAAAMNYGAQFAPSARWLVFTNNDLTCRAPYLRLFDELDDGAVYGNDVIEWWGRRWLDGWILAVPRRIWNAVSEFDTNFIYAGFEDADFCFRALELGFKVEQYPFPFVHRELHSRFSMPDYMAQRERNIAYLCGKWGITR